jgi:hypothetical protein
MQAHQLEKKIMEAVKKKQKHTTGLKPLQTSGTAGSKAILWHHNTLLRDPHFQDGQGDADITD